jgi:hypothetical protein
MIFSPLVSIPADEESREDAPRSHLITKKDVKKFLIALPFILVALFFTYRHFKKISDWHICASNMNSVYKGLSLYSNDHDDRFPPLSSSNPSTGAPYVTDGVVNTWVSQVSPYGKDPQIFHCPAAEPGESVATEASIHDNPDGSPRQVTVQSTYGMYAGYASASTSLIERSGSSVLLAETSNNGSASSFDPTPYKDSSGAVIPYDGFSVGWDNNNLAPDLHTKYVTRLALRNSANGDFTKAETRHANGNHAITPDGNLIIQHAQDARITMQGGVPSGEWRTAPMAP